MKYQDTMSETDTIKDKNDDEILLKVQDLAVRFELEERTIQAVNHNNFSIKKGEILGLVGESGSGKSVTSRAILNMIQDPGVIESGSVIFRDKDMLQLPTKKVRSIRGREISMVFQDPAGSLNPVFTIGFQIRRVLHINRGTNQPSRIRQWLNRLPGSNSGLSKIEEQAIKLLDRVGIPNPTESLSKYPHQLSGGQRQRVLIAMAIAADPEILIADEPTTALDVTIEAQIFDLLNELRKEVGMSMLLITHDLSIIADVADRVITMYAGNIIEKAPVYELYDNPMHPYTEALLDLVLRTDQDIEELKPIPGEVPDLSDVPSGCPFHPRCSKAVDECSKVVPELREIKSEHNVACIEAEGYENAN